MEGYLRSIAWFRRRDRWFDEELSRQGEIRCAVCRKRGGRRSFELHHVGYEGVTRTPTGDWVAGEAHADLIAVHPRCHEWIHTVLDRDLAASAAVDRRRANERVIRRLQAKFAEELGRLTDE